MRLVELNRHKFITKDMYTELAKYNGKCGPTNAFGPSLLKNKQRLIIVGPGSVT